MAVTVRLNPSGCLGCGKSVDAATNAYGKSKPRPGNITICLYCGHIQAFAVDLSMRPLTDKEMFEVAGDEKIIKIQKARRLAALMNNLKMP